MILTKRQADGIHTIETMAGFRHKITLQHTLLSNEGVRFACLNGELDSELLIPKWRDSLLAEGWAETVKEEETNNPARITSFAESAVSGFKSAHDFPVQYLNIVPGGFEYFVFGSLKTLRPKGSYPVYDFWGNPNPSHDFSMYTVVVRETVKDGLTVQKQYKGCYA